MERRSDSILICVQVDRCWNRYWRCLLLLGFLIFGIILLVLLRSGNDSGPMLETNWQKHWSQTQDSAPGSKQIFQSSGNVVNVRNEFVHEYVAQEHDREPDDGEYYDRDSPDVEQRDSEYMQQYRNDEMMGKQDKAQPGSMGVVPDIHDYSLQENFRHVFTNSLEESIQFEENYANPCWSETIPKLPYQNNSYLKVKEQAAVLEPQFKYMRQLFAKRSDPSNRWRLRCLPHFYIMETPPMATPRLYSALRFHPLIVNPDMSEPEFWNQRGPEGIASLKDYLDIFDAASEKIRSNTSSVLKDGRVVLEHRQVTGDGTSSYLWAVDRWRNLLGNLGEPEPKTTVPDIIKKLTPHAKIVMVLRNPTERLFLGYISQTENPSASDFHSKTGQALNSMTSCEKKRNIRSCVYDSFLNKRLPVRLRIGMYYPFIHDWINVFGDQVKVIRYEDYISNPSEVINDVCSFLELTPYPTKDLESMEAMIKDMEKKRKTNQKLKMLSATRAMLKEFHRKLNQQLANLLQDEKFLWPELDVDPDEVKEQLAPTEAQQRELDDRQLQEKARLAREQLARDQQTRDQQTRDQQTRDQQAKDQQAREQQARDQQAREQQARDQQTREQQAREQQARDQQAREQQARDQQIREQQAREQQTREQQATDQQTREQAKDQQAKDQQAKDQQAKDQQAREQQARERQAREQQAREQQAREQQAREQQAREQQAREQQAREQQAREQQAREQQAREQQAREQQTREQQARQLKEEQQQAQIQQREQQQKQQQLDQQRVQQNQINQQVQQYQGQHSQSQQIQQNQQQGQDQSNQYQTQQNQQG